MNHGVNLVLPCDVGLVSDGTNTFDSLYETIAALFVTVLLKHPENTWYSFLKKDGSPVERNWFYVGINSDSLCITTKLPIHVSVLMESLEVEELPTAPHSVDHLLKITDQLYKYIYAETKVVN